MRRVKRHTLADKNAENGILICRNPAVTKRFNLLLHSLKDNRGQLIAEHTMDGIHFDAAAYRTVFDRLRKWL